MGAGNQDEKATKQRDEKTAEPVSKVHRGIKKHQDGIGNLSDLVRWGQSIAYLSSKMRIEVGSRDDIWRVDPRAGSDPAGVPRPRLRPDGNTSFQHPPNGPQATQNQKRETQRRNLEGRNV